MSKVASPARQGSSFLALACVGFIASAPSAQANHFSDPVAGKGAPDAASDDQDGSKNTILVSGHLAQQQASPKARRPVRDTPQTVTVLSKEVIEQQNLLTLRDMLSTVPGITFGAAEGGNGPGDTITLRGYSATTDITTDGVRDSGQYTRTDNYNLEQLEVVNGANSVYNGSGSVGGAINIVTKRPLEQTAISVQAGLGTDRYYRGVIDANVRATDLIAVRLNAMIHRNDVPGRDVEKYKRWGVAPSVMIGVEGPTSLTLLYNHQEDTNTPQYGVPYYKNALFNGALPGINRKDYFGYRNVDTQRITSDQATAIFAHTISDNVSVRNLTRWQKVSQHTIVGPPQGTLCLKNGTQPNGSACPATVPAGYYLIGGPRGNTRNTQNQLMYNQLDLSAKFNTGALEHSLVIGASAAWEKYTLSAGNVYRNPNGTVANAAFPLINLERPNEIVPGRAGFNYGSNVYTGPINYFESSRQRGEVSNFAIYAFDAIRLGKLELNGGVRYERNKGNFQTDVGAAATTTTPQGPVVSGARFFNKANLFTYRVGLVFKPVEAVSLYAAYGNAQTPSQSAVNGACVLATCNVAPETAKNYEIGAKAELFSGHLLVSAAAFRNERDQFKVPSNDPFEPDQVLDGRSRVDGIAVSASGAITPAWTITANYTHLRPRLLQSVSNFCLAKPSAACGNNAALLDPAAGAELQNTPRNSGSLFTSYTLPFGLKLGYGVTYQGSFALNLPTVTNRTVVRSDSYWMHSATIGYDITRNLIAQLNVKNFTDKVYYTRIRNNGWATPGDARQVVFTLGYRF